jgi:hypothetical protein
MKRRITSEEYKMVIALLGRLSRPELASVRASCASRLRRNYAGGRPPKPEPDASRLDASASEPWD